MSDQNMLELISEITELNDIHEFMQDTTVDDAMGYIIKLIAKPDVPAARAPGLIVRLQALSSQCAIKAKYYTVFEKGGENTKRKNVYYTLEDCLDKLAQAIKYSARYGLEN